MILVGNVVFVSTIKAQNLKVINGEVLIFMKNREKWLHFLLISFIYAWNYTSVSLW